MLVLSRRPKEKILFPSLNASVQVLAIKAGTVRLGIEAPPDVAIVREEILDRCHQPVQSQASKLSPDVTSEFRQLRHLVRNRLNAAGIGLAVLREQLKAGQLQGSEATLATISQEFQTLRQSMESVAEVAKPQPTPRPGRKALLVEDDHNERELLAGLLRIAGLDVDTAGDGVAALDYLHTRGRPDVVLLDMVMPRCDGPTMLREIRGDPAYAGLKIFAVSGHSPDELLLDSDWAAPGVDRWFHKPLNPEAFLHDLNQELDGCLSRR